MRDGKTTLGATRSDRQRSQERGAFRRALEISLLLHMLLIFLIAPRLLQIWPDSEQAVAKLVPIEQPPESQQRPLEFELVDLAEEREETPVSPDVPLSDLDRRAHGGEGAAADRAASRGNTFQLIQRDGSGERFEMPQRPTSEPVPPVEQRPEQQQPEKPEEQQDQEEELRLEGAGQDGQPQLQLPQPRSWAVPPDLSGKLEIPDREGGSVDTGGLSFDTQWYDWGPYAKAMLRKIRRNWHIPQIARLGVPGVAKIRFYIERDGTVSGLSILDESGKPPMDFAARDAISLSSPFMPLPPDLAGVIREGVTITFFYNQKPPNRSRY